MTSNTGYNNYVDSIDHTGYPKCCCPTPALSECTTNADCNSNCGVCVDGQCELSPLTGPVLSRWRDPNGFARDLPYRSKNVSASAPANYDGNKINFQDDYPGYPVAYEMPSARNAPVCP